LLLAIQRESTNNRLSMQIAHPNMSGVAALFMLVLQVIPVAGIFLGRGAPLQASPQKGALDHAVPHEGEHASRQWVRNGTLDEDGEHSEDAQTWKLGQPQSLVSRVLPPKCPSEVSEDSPYMQEYVLPNKIHTICKYRQPCDKVGTNLERLQSIRGLLKATKKELNKRGVSYALYGGSAIGQQRCEDVLPWDADCDVVVWMHDVHKIVGGDIDGPNGRHSMMKTDGNSAIPYVVADKKTGFYCDVFFMDYDEVSQQVDIAWPWGTYSCPNMDTTWPFNSEPKRCNKFPRDTIHPFKPCVLDGVTHNCLANQPAYLAQEYGGDVTQPNVSTALVAHSPTKGTQMLQGIHPATDRWQNMAVLGMTFLLLIFAGVFVSKRSGGGWNTVYMAAYLGFGVCEYLLARSISIQHGGLPFYAPCGVVVIDAIKLVVTLSLIAWSRTWECIGKVTYPDAAQLLVPVVMYFGLNTLFYIAISAVVLASYAITFELQIIVVAALGWVVFGRSLSTAQAAACIGVIGGAFIHHVGEHAKGASWQGIFLPACMAVWAATCTITCEYVFKAGARLDINAQNLYMYGFSIVLGFCVAFVMKWFGGLSWSEMLVGLSNPSVIALLALRAVFGIACSRILKYMDSLSKTIASALCAPLALGLAPLVINEHISTLTVVAIVITYVASLVFWTNPGAPTDVPAESDKLADVKCSVKQTS